MMKLTTRRLPSAGFTLVEIMVAVAIGLATVLVATQVLVKSMEQKRASASGNDSMVNATLALYTIERDVKNSGFGLTTLRQYIGCTVHAKFKGSTDNRDFNLVPVTITDGGSASADTLRLFASGERTFPLPVRIAETKPMENAVFFVESDLGVEEGDIMIAIPGPESSETDCALFQATALATPGNSNESQGVGPGLKKINRATRDGTWNVPLNTAGSAFEGRSYGKGDYVLNLGAFIDHTYSIDEGSLWLDRYQMETNAPNDQAIYPHIVQLQAVYGKDTDGDGEINDWDATAPADWRHVVAVRIALVARGSVREATEVTPPNDTCETAAAASLAVMPVATAVCWRPNPNAPPVDIDMNIDDANPDWRRYRYRVLETTIPLRNSIWFQ
jgi:type IV pilus assembly protein PilW